MIIVFHNEIYILVLYRIIGTFCLRKAVMKQCTTDVIIYVTR